MKKNTLFVIGNEYHLYSSIVMFYKYFNSELYNFKLIITKRPTNRRINENYNLPFKHYLFDDYLNFNDFLSVKKYPDYEKELSIIFDRVDEIYIYYDFTLLSSLIINWVKRNPKSKVFMVQEGVAGYFTYKMPLYKMVKFYLTYLYVKFIKQIKKIDFVYQWGYYSKVDVLKMFHPEEVRIKTKAKIEKLDLSIDSATNNKVKDIFGFNKSFDPHIKYLLYMPIGQARGSAVAKKRELDLISRFIELADKYNYVFVMKIKSGVDSDLYHSLYGDKVIIIDDKVPAEVIISDMHNSIVISAFSSAALHDVNKNRYYWVFPILGFKTRLIPPTKKIKLLSQLSELETIF